VRLTLNFDSDEFDCHSGEGVPAHVIPNLKRLCMTVLQPLREEWYGPIIIVSGWRSPKWNEKVGGAKASKHMTGEAADIRPVFLDTLPKFEAMVERLWANGRLPGLGAIGKYPRWLHLDIRPKKPNGTLARWDGRGVGSENA